MIKEHSSKYCFSNLNRADLFVIFYENDQDSRQFVSDCVSSIPKYLPVFLVEVKNTVNLRVSQINDPSTQLQAFARHLGIKATKEVEDPYVDTQLKAKEVIDMIM